MPKDRGAEQGDVDGPLERSLALGMWRPKRECALRCNMPLEPSPGRHARLTAERRLQDEPR